MGSETLKSKEENAHWSLVLAGGRRRGPTLNERNLHDGYI
jgi:hypothetical protein